MNINKIILAGKVVSDITFSKTETESSIARFTLATNRFFKGRNGERKTDTCYHNMVAWDLIAETIAKYVKKGDELGISGRLNNKSVKQEDGSYKNYSQVVIEEFYFGDNKNKKEQPEAKEIDDEVIEEAINREIGDIPF